MLPHAGSKVPDAQTSNLGCPWKNMLTCTQVKGPGKALTWKNTLCKSTFWSLLNNSDHVRPCPCELISQRLFHSKEKKKKETEELPQTQRPEHLITVTNVKTKTITKTIGSCTLPLFNVNQRTLIHRHHKALGGRRAVLC